MLRKTRKTRELSYPVDLEAERAFISAFLTSNNYRMDRYYCLPLDVFFAPEHRIIVEAMGELDSNNIPVSRDELIRQLERTDMMSTAVMSALNAVRERLISEDEMKIVRCRLIDCSIVRRLIDRLTNTTCWLADGDIDSKKFLQWTHDCLIQLNNCKEFLL